MKLLKSEKDISWYLDEMEHHVREIRKLLERGEETYKRRETCREHAKVEAYDLIVLTAEAFRMQEIIDVIPEEIIERFNRKRLNDK
ncbi:MAG TPA: hypothetical protein EYP86_00110 [Candidatus Altiarchaeales archaeon]|nr:hypothetical protein [Candidatus Altiarchaeales archaeon]